MAAELAHASGHSPRQALLARLVLMTLACAVGMAAHGAPDALAPFFGAYVGVADVEDLQTGQRQHRDMDIVIEPYDDHGFRLHWVNVTRVDGRRDVPGVERRVQTALFKPADGRDFFVEIQEGSPFREREQTRPMQGDPVRWAAVDDRALNVYSFVVLDDGRYALQTYERRRTEQGIDVKFESIVDGEVIRRINGTTVRANTVAEEE